MPCCCCHAYGEVPPCLFDKHGAVEKARKDFDRSLAGLFFCPYDNCGNYCVTTVTVVGGHNEMLWIALTLACCAIFSLVRLWGIVGELRRRVKFMEMHARHRGWPDWDESETDL